MKVGTEVILMNCIWRRKVVTIVICGLCGSTASGKTVPKGYVGNKVRKVYRPYSTMPFKERTAYPAHE
jgi:hypothetical protein